MRCLVWLLALSYAAAEAAAPPALASYPMDLHEQWDRAFSEGNIDRLVSLYASSAVSMPPGGETVRGRKDIRREFTIFFAGSDSARHETIVEELLLADSSTTVASATSVEGATVIERARYRMTYVRKSDGVRISESGRHVMARRLVDGEWRIVWEIWNQGP